MTSWSSTTGKPPTSTTSCTGIPSASQRIRLAAWSGEALSRWITRTTRTVCPRWWSRRAITSPSPPLLPIPTTTRKGVWNRGSLGQRATCRNRCAVQRVAARSIRSSELMGSWAMVYASAACIWEALRTGNMVPQVTERCLRSAVGHQVGVTSPCRPTWARSGMHRGRVAQRCRRPGDRCRACVAHRLRPQESPCDHRVSTGPTDRAARKAPRK